MVFGGYGYLFFFHPEYTRWWRRAVNSQIERICDMFPDQLGAQVESIVGNLGFFAQMFIATLILRLVVTFVFILGRISRGQ
jgi:hypothetical protein